MAEQSSGWRTNLPIKVLTILVIFAAIFLLYNVLNPKVPGPTAPLPGPGPTAPLPGPGPTEPLPGPGPTQPIAPAPTP